MADPSYPPVDSHIFMPHDFAIQAVEHIMLKEVGASGQISLGKKYAGRLFNMVVHADDRVELVPMHVVAAGRAARQTPADTDWLPPGGYGHANEWARANRAALEQYAAEIEAHGTAGEQLQAYLQDPEARG
jgi:hypothetical protein